MAAIDFDALMKEELARATRSNKTSQNFEEEKTNSIEPSISTRDPLGLDDKPTTVQHAISTLPSVHLSPRTALNMEVREAPISAKKSSPS